MRIAHAIWKSVCECVWEEEEASCICGHYNVSASAAPAVEFRLRKRKKRGPVCGLSASCERERGRLVFFCSVEWIFVGELRLGFIDLGV